MDNKKPFSMVSTIFCTILVVVVFIGIYNLVSAQHTITEQQAKITALRERASGYEFESETVIDAYTERQKNIQRQVLDEQSFVKALVSVEFSSEKPLWLSDRDFDKIHDVIMNLPDISYNAEVELVPVTYDEVTDVFRYCAFIKIAHGVVGENQTSTISTVLFTFDADSSNVLSNFTGALLMNERML